ncbi:thioesterase domain-containing protein [Aestuariirhabdus sp. Z084]|uniref:YiiD C-terminal domain-containing protein n=1 Tax=Aestuariirhabdus haliotis TaxID=2918751 RepID=UPI00201B42D2|nr:YiiD C-terminal domain-containing protein [Aestuariirhabdus haliotis]MCL6416453.1 thioesterase domain-containing protein [Aestuariirhabdus haliotis]MCL6420443.1 thioesterase domain-containing protein [Aestuariirhabdus haliotis]
MSDSQAYPLAKALEARILEQIPLLSAMQVRLEHYDGESLRLSAPLPPNINDKGTAFGGSLATLVTITGWCFTTLLADQVGANEVVVADSQMNYLKPVTAELNSYCILEADSRTSFLNLLESRGKASLQLEVNIAEPEPALRFQGRYVALLRNAT